MSLEYRRSRTPWAARVWAEAAEIRIRVNGLVDAANQQALVLGAIADGGGLAQVRGWAGPSERNIAVHTIVANSVTSDTKRLEQVRGRSSSPIRPRRPARPTRP